MFIFYFDPSYTDVRTLKLLKETLKIRFVFSLMRPNELSDGIKRLHKSSFVDYWEPSYEETYNAAYKIIGDKITPLISRPFYYKKSLETYIGAGCVVKNRPIYTFAKEDCESIHNVLILRRRYFINNDVLEPQSPPGGTIKRIKENLKKQDVSKVSKDSIYYKSKNGTLSALENVFFITLDTTLDDIIKINKSLKNFSYTHSDSDKGEWRKIYELKQLESMLKLDFDGDITKPELLILNEYKISEYIKDLPHPNLLNSNIQNLKRFIFSQYIIHLFCRKFSKGPEYVIEKFMTPLGRKKYEEENHNRDLENNKRWERYCRDMESRQAYFDEKKEIESELKDLSENGGDWIFD